MIISKIYHFDVVMTSLLHHVSTGLAIWRKYHIYQPCIILISHTPINKIDSWRRKTQQGLRNYLWPWFNIKMSHQYRDCLCDIYHNLISTMGMGKPGEREREIKFIGLFEDRGHRGPYSPYKPFNHNLYIGIIIFPHIDNPQSTGYN